MPSTFELAASLIRPGGRVANIGVHGEPATLHLEELWIKDVTITTGLVDTYSTPTLLRLIQGGSIDPSPLVTHHFGMDEFDAGVRRVQPGLRHGGAEGGSPQHLTSGIDTVLTLAEREDRVFTAGQVSDRFEASPRSSARPI